MRSSPLSAILVVLLMVLTPLSASIASSPEQGSDLAAAGALDGGRFSLMSEWTYNFSVENTLLDARGPELAWVDVGVPPGVMHDVDEVSLFAAAGGQEMPVGILSGDVTTHADGSLHRVTIHFKDSWAAEETKDYRAVFGRRSQVSGGLMSASQNNDFVVVNDGNRQYQVHIDDSPRFSPQGLYYLYILNGELRAHGSALTRVGGNQLEPDQASFQMWWGLHTYLDIDRSPLAVRVTLGYDDPEIVHWGPSGATIQQILRHTDFISAEIVLTFYKGIPRIDTHSKKVIDERFWNHNGFVMEFSAILGSGADWQGEFETVYGTNIHQVMTTTTQGPTWTRQSTTWQDIDVASDAAPAFFDLDDDGDLDMVLGSEGQGIKVFENVGDASAAQMVENVSWAAGLPNVTSATPTLGDLDGDGDAELLIGQVEGYLKLYRNDGGASGPPNWTRWMGNFDRLGLGPNTAPNFGDADGDGDLDIVVGLGSGKLKGIINTGTPTAHSWSMDDTWVQHLSQGLTKAPCDGYSVPYMVDVDYDGDTDLLLGSDDGKVIVFENMGDARNVRWTRLDVSHHAGVVTGSPWESNSTPVMVDIDADGDRDLLIGTHRGTVYHYSFDGNTTPAKGHNNLQPLLNGSYRHMRDKDGNDGPFAVEGYANEWYGYYVLANPRNGYAAMRYIPDWDRLAYKQEYWGDEFSFAGGNVSYYPYEPVAKEYVTRAQITSNPMSNGVSAGSFISQTGTSAGFVMQPMTAMVYESDEILLLDLQRQGDPGDYDRYVEPLQAPLEVLQPVNLRVVRVWTVPAIPSDGERTHLYLAIENTGSQAISHLKVDVEIEHTRSSDRYEWETIHFVLTEDLQPGMTTIDAPFDTWGMAGKVELNATVNPYNVEQESDYLDNSLAHTFTVLPDDIPLSDPFPVTTRTNSSLDADAIVRSDGQLYVVWETVQGKEEIDIEGRTFDPATSTWGPIEALISGDHYAVEPDLALADDKIYLAYSSNINALEMYHQTAHAKYYWGEKFDLYVKEWDQGVWDPSLQVTSAIDYDDSHQAPELVFWDDGMEVFFRCTHFQFYTNGNQMDNLPFQDMDLRSAYEVGGGGWSAGNRTVGITEGSQGWWGGPAGTVHGDDEYWVVYESEVGNSQWDLYAEWGRPGSPSPGLVRITSTGGANEIRPAIVSGGTEPLMLLAYETDKNGNRDIAVRLKEGNQAWGPEVLLTTDTASDMKPSVAYDGHGSYWVAWESYRTGDKDIFVSRFDGTDWHGPYQVTEDPGSDEQPVLACDQATGRVYVVWETDRNGMGNKDIYMAYIHPHAPSLSLAEVADAAEDETIKVEGVLVDIDGDFHHIEWDWGDGNSSISPEEDGSHSFERAGTYSVSAQAFDRYGLSSNVATVTINVSNLPPTARLGGTFEADEDEEHLFYLLTTKDTKSDQDSLLVEMDFGDGARMGPVPLSEHPNITHTYTASGVYTVALTAIDDDGDEDTVERDMTVHNLLPAAEAWARFEDLDEDEEGEFSGIGSDTPSDMSRGLTYLWEWGDGTSSELSKEPLAIHSYAKAGLFLATLHVIDDDGDEGTATVNVTVYNLPPTLEITGPMVVDEDEEVTLTAVATDTSHDLDLLEYLWDWGDGTTLDWSTTSEATHTYTASGNFQVTVSVRDDDGEEVSSSLPMAVDNIKPEAKAMASKQVATEGDTVHFSAAGSTDTPSDLKGLTYNWDLGSEFVEEYEFNYVFRSPGLYSITLTVTDDDGETARAKLDIVVTNRPPVAEGWVSSLEVKVGKFIAFDAANSTDDQWDLGGLKYRWDMSDGTVYNTKTGSHAYLYPGSYSIRLTVTDGDGGSHEWVTTVTVQPTGQDDDDDGGGMSTAMIGGLALVVLVVIVVAVLLVLRSRGKKGEDEGEEVETEEALPPLDDLPEAGEAVPETEVEPEAEAPPEPEVELVEEEVEVIRPREGETDPADLIQRIEQDLGPDEE